MAVSAALLVSLGAVSAPAGVAGALDRAIRTYFSPLQAAADRAAASRGESDAVQTQYDVARDFLEALRAASPVPSPCANRYGAALSYARAEVFEAEGYDRISPARIARGARRSDAAAARLRRYSRPCSGAGAVAVAKAWPFSPVSNAVVLGRVRVVSHLPAGSDCVAVIVNGGAPRMFVPHGSRFAVTVATRSGRYTVALRYFRRGRLLATSLASQVWLLPQSARTTVPARTTNLGWVRALRAAGASFDGYAGFWMHDISTGASAEWNADALFPAASTVKLGVLIAALKRFGPRPEGSRYGYDMGALAGWSSNLAANRLVSGLGGADVGSVAAEQTMQRLGANSSTYTGFYRVGTSARHAGNAPRQPPRVSTRVTTARDLGRLLYVLHAGAMGDPAAMRLLQLSRHEAQVGLGLLLSSAPTGDNVGLFRPSLGKTYPIAQKNGWITTARHTAAILYTSHGPVIVVVLTYRPAGLTRVDTTRLAERVLRLVHK